MRSRTSANDHAAEVARRRLELLSAELAATRPAPVDPPSHQDRGGSGEPPAEKVEQSLASPASTGAPEARPGRHALRPVGRALAAGWVEDRLPPSLQGRVRIGAAHLATVAVLVAAAMAFLAWGAVRASDPGDLVPARSSARPSTAPGSVLATPSAAQIGTAAAAASPTVDVVVDVAGKVRRPGIVTLPAGSRVVDALEAAGGPRRGVRLTSLNLARLLVDGEQLLVGIGPVPGVAASAASAPGASPAPLVNLNTADGSALETLPGIGPVTADAILQWRAEHGAFSAVDELMEVSGIGEATLAELAPFVTV